MTAQRTNQAARYTAIVSASAASLTLTVAAGAYVMSQISPSASTTTPATTLDRPDRSVIEVQPRIARAFTAAAPGGSAPAPASFGVGGTGGRVFAPVTDPPAVDLPAAQTVPQPAPARRTESGSSLDLGVAELNTHRDEQHTTVTLTVDPEVTAALHGLLTESPTDPSGPTTLSTDIDRGRGGVALGFSDPLLGERSVEVPGTRPAARPAGPTPV
ncbi:hypothetical protein IU449_19590 [Nocardia higoensis]|uniref:Uncharacterized protein n=1 Tax=Nocardia higoensis TaxID=228599 RepID=A0ABS0DE33_9NOCA|nr:hypothetical protein [Nocardia higoensis]MBF6356722.1 hypothetical protein [Nocardia higoensis]